MAEQRVIRIYICSTFPDMQAEREYLHSVAIPELRRRCAALGVEAVAIDPLVQLQSEEEAEDPRRLKGCLEAIDACDFFIALLGERYGRPILQVPEDAALAHGWLRGYPGRSRVALEITQALSGARAEWAHFYFR